MSAITPCPEDDFDALREVEAALRKQSILTEAQSIISGSRNEAYGDHERECERIAAIWNVLVEGRTITADLVDMMMVTMKMVRETHRSKRDNLVDMLGYLMLMADRRQ